MVICQNDDFCLSKCMHVVYMYISSIWKYIKTTIPDAVVFLLARSRSLITDTYARWQCLPKESVKRSRKLMLRPIACPQSLQTVLCRDTECIILGENHLNNVHQRAVLCNIPHNKAGVRNYLLTTLRRA